MTAMRRLEVGRAFQRKAKKLGISEENIANRKVW